MRGTKKRRMSCEFGEGRPSPSKAHDVHETVDNLVFENPNQHTPVSLGRPTGSDINPGPRRKRSGAQQEESSSSAKKRRSGSRRCLYWKQEGILEPDITSNSQRSVDNVKSKSKQRDGTSNAPESVYNMLMERKTRRLSLGSPAPVGKKSTRGGKKSASKTQHHDNVASAAEKQVVSTARRRSTGQRAAFSTAIRKLRETETASENKDSVARSSPDKPFSGKCPPMQQFTQTSIAPDQTLDTDNGKASDSAASSHNIGAPDSKNPGRLVLDNLTAPDCDDPAALKSGNVACAVSEEPQTAESDADDANSLTVFAMDIWCSDSSGSDSEVENGPTASPTAAEESPGSASARRNLLLPLAADGSGNSGSQSCSSMPTLRDVSDTGSSWLDGLLHPANRNKMCYSHTAVGTRSRGRSSALGSTAAMGDRRRRLNALPSSERSGLSLAESDMNVSSSMRSHSHLSTSSYCARSAADRPDAGIPARRERTAASHSRCERSLRADHWNPPSSLESLVVEKDPRSYWYRPLEVLPNLSSNLITPNTKYEQNSARTKSLRKYERGKRTGVIELSATEIMSGDRAGEHGWTDPLTTERWSMEILQASGGRSGPSVPSRRRQTTESPPVGGTVVPSAAQHALLEHTDDYSAGEHHQSSVLEWRRRSYSQSGHPPEQPSECCLPPPEVARGDDPRRDSDTDVYYMAAVSPLRDLNGGGYVDAMDAPEQDTAHPGSQQLLFFAEAVSSHPSTQEFLLERELLMGEEVDSLRGRHRAATLHAVTDVVQTCHQTPHMKRESRAWSTGGADPPDTSSADVHRPSWCRDDTEAPIGAVQLQVEPLALGQHDGEYCKAQAAGRPTNGEQPSSAPFGCSRQRSSVVVSCTLRRMVVRWRRLAQLEWRTMVALDAAIDRQWRTGVALLSLCTSGDRWRRCAMSSILAICDQLERQLA